MGRIIGIDLGTTNSVVAVMEGGQPVVILNSEGKPTTPSVVGITKAGERLVGELAKRQAVSSPERTVISIKRQMGQDYKVVIDNKEYTPQEISSIILQKLKSDAESYLGESIDKAVITVPAYFNDSQRQATKDAGTIAGLEVLRIINEPTAAAIAYGLDKQEVVQKVLIFDLGGGTFDVSILEIGDGVFEVIATSGDTNLGGDDWDQRIIDFCVDNFKKNYNIDLKLDRFAMQRLKESAEKAKIELSSKETTKINLPFIASDATGPKHLNIELTRQQFEELTKDLIERLDIPVKNALKDADIPLGEIDKVIMVGGSTRMPAVRKRAKKLLLKDPITDIDPDLVVAMGAAIQAGILGGEVKDMILLDVTSLSLGVETAGGGFTKIIERNSQIPTSKSKIFTTVVDGQTEVSVNIYQGERELVKYNKFLGSFELRNIPPAPRGVPKIEVTFEIDVDGIVSVSAKDLSTGIKQKITIDSPTNLSKEEIDRMIEEAKAHAEFDRKIKEERQIKTKAQVEIDVAERTLRDFGSLNEKYANKIKEALERLKISIEGNDLERIKEDTASLQDSVFALTTYLYTDEAKTQAEDLSTITATKDGKNKDSKDKEAVAGLDDINLDDIMSWFKKEE